MSEDETKLQEIIKTVLEKSLAAIEVELKDAKLAYKICSGFSKSGSVLLYIDKSMRIVCEARYDEQSVIEDFDDLVRISFNWYSRYSDRKPFEYPNEDWAKEYIRLGLVKAVTKTVYEII